MQNLNKLILYKEKDFSGELKSFLNLSSVIKNKLTIINAGLDRIVYSDNISDEALVAITGSQTYANMLKEQFSENDIPLTEDNVKAVDEAYDDFGKLGNERINTAGNAKTVTLTGVQNMFPSDIPDPNNDSAKTEIFKAINSERSASGLKEVSLSKELSYVADIRAQELSVKFDGATRPDGSANRTLLSQYGLTSSHDVLLYSNDSSYQIFISTLKQSYIKKIRDGGFGKVGIGHYYSGSKHYWVVYLST